MSNLDLTKILSMKYRGLPDKKKVRSRERVGRKGRDAIKGRDIVTFGMGGKYVLPGRYNLFELSNLLTLLMVD